MLQGGLGLLERVRTNVVLELFEGLAELRREEIGARGDPLPKLDEGRTCSLHSPEQQRKPGLLELWEKEEKKEEILWKAQNYFVGVKTQTNGLERAQRKKARKRELTLGKSKVRVPRTTAGRKMRASFVNLKAVKTSSTTLHGCLRATGALARRDARAEPR